MLALRQLKHKLPLSHLRADICDQNTGFLLKLADRGLLERLSLLDAAARGGPVVLSRKRALLVKKPEKQDATCAVQDQEPGGWSATPSVQLHAGFIAKNAAAAATLPTGAR